MRKRVGRLYRLNLLFRTSSPSFDLFDRFSGRKFKSGFFLRFFRLAHFGRGSERNEICVSLDTVRFFEIGFSFELSFNDVGIISIGSAQKLRAAKVSVKIVAVAIWKIVIAVVEVIVVAIWEIVVVAIGEVVVAVV